MSERRSGSSSLRNNRRSVIRPLSERARHVNHSPAKAKPFAGASGRCGSDRSGECAESESEPLQDCTDCHCPLRPFRVASPREPRRSGRLPAHAWARMRAVVFLHGAEGSTTGLETSISESSCHCEAWAKAYRMVEPAPGGLGPGLQHCAQDVSELVEPVGHRPCAGSWSGHTAPRGTGDSFLD